MKRFLTVLTVICGLGLGSASAQGAYLGLRTGFPFLIGLQAGYDFGAFGEGFGLRGVAEGTFFGTAGVFNLAVDAYNRFGFGDFGTNAYIGAGAGLIGGGALGVSSSASIFDLHLLAGIEFLFSRSFGVFLEITPFFVVFPSTGPQFYTLPIFSLGASFRF